MKNTIRHRKTGEKSEAKDQQVIANHGEYKMSVKKIFILFVGFTSVIILASTLNLLPWKLQSHATNSLDSIALSLGMQKHVYAIIIDAGSTGSRVLAFTFHKSIVDNSLKLDNELFVEVKPGLSAFADDPRKCREGLVQLLDKAKAFIPSSEWQYAPLAMKATAGLRLLPEKKAEALLNEVRSLFQESPFYTSRNSVSIMDGVDEGLFSWFTVNFLLDRLGQGADYTVAALDLGGGSNQITYAPKVVTPVLQANIHNISAFRHNISVYTRSYLGLGLMAMRKAVLSVGNEKNSTILKSECINPIVKTKWGYGGIAYEVHGSDSPQYRQIKGSRNTVGENRPIVNYNLCLKIVRDYVKNKVNQLPDMKTKQINAFSYYFDKAIEYGLIDPLTGGIVTVNDFVKAAKDTCDTPNVDQPFLCLDLSFITVLLQDGFGLDLKTPVNLFKKIDGHEISWALGAAYHILQNGL